MIYLTYAVSGYNLVVKSRTHKQCGGVGIFVLEDNYKFRDDLLCADAFADTVLLEVLPNNVIISCIYNPPNGDVTFFTAYLDTLLSKIKSKKKTAKLPGI